MCNLLKCCSLLAIKTVNQMKALIINVWAERFSRFSLKQRIMNSSASSTKLHPQCFMHNRIARGAKIVQWGSLHHLCICVPTQKGF